MAEWVSRMTWDECLTYNLTESWSKAVESTTWYFYFYSKIRGLEKFNWLKGTGLKKMATHPRASRNWFLNLKFKNDFKILLEFNFSHSQICQMYVIQKKLASFSSLNFNHTRKWNKFAKSVNMNWYSISEIKEMTFKNCIPKLECRSRRRSFTIRNIFSVF